jgi:hypothetical protein
LSAWADVYRRINPMRRAYANHSDPPWYDLRQKGFSCSAGATICVNGDGIVERVAEAWPGVQKLMDGKPINDRGAYPAGEFNLTAHAVSDSGPISEINFGKSINGGNDGESTVVDTDGKSSIYATNMISAE